MLSFVWVNCAALSLTFPLSLYICLRLVLPLFVSLELRPGHGPAMARPWPSYGPAMARPWPSYGPAMARPARPSPRQEVSVNRSPRL